MTFSLVAFDKATKQVGVAAQSRSFALGRMVPWARAGAGAIATQANTNGTYGPEGLKLLAEGVTPQQAIDRLTAADPGRKIRQVGMVDVRGRAAAYTGENCLDWAGHLVGDGWTCQGNILEGPQVVQAMADAYAAASGPLAERLLAALAAGQEAGGDIRGMQSAALLIADSTANHPDGHLLSLRVDDHSKPIYELTRLYQVWQRHQEWEAAEWTDYTGVIVMVVEQIMRRRGIPGLQPLAEALGVPDGIRGSKVNRAFREAIHRERQK